MTPALWMEVATSEHDLILRMLALGIAVSMTWTWVLVAQLLSRLDEIRKLLEKK